MLATLSPWLGLGQIYSSLDRYGVAEMKSLSKVDSLTAQKIPCLLVFDTFGNGLEIEGLGHTDDGAYQVLIGLVGQNVAHEFHVDFQMLDKEPLQIGKAA